MYAIYFDYNNENSEAYQFKFAIALQGNDYENGNFNGDTVYRNLRPFQQDPETMAKHGKYMRELLESCGINSNEPLTPDQIAESVIYCTAKIVISSFEVEENGAYRGLICHDNQIVGGVLYGDMGLTAEIQDAVETGQRLQEATELAKHFPGTSALMA